MKKETKATLYAIFCVALTVLMYIVGICLTVAVALGIIYCVVKFTKCTLIVFCVVVIIGLLIISSKDSIAETYKKHKQKYLEKHSKEDGD